MSDGTVDVTPLTSGWCVDCAARGLNRRAAEGDQRCAAHGGAVEGPPRRIHPRRLCPHPLGKRTESGECERCGETGLEARARAGRVAPVALQLAGELAGRWDGLEYRRPGRRRLRALP